jgi:Immunoglobulin domain
LEENLKPAEFMRTAFADVSARGLSRGAAAWRCAGRRRATLGVFWAVVLLCGQSPAHAQAVVSDCTEKALRDALSASTNVVFDEDCTIALAAPVDIQSNAYSIHAEGHQVTITGGGGNRLFIVHSSASLELAGVTLRNGRSTNGGALYIEAGAAVVLTNCELSANSATGTNGAPGVDGHSGGLGGGGGTKGSPGGPGLGGAICNLGNLEVLRCRFLTNSASGGDGGDAGNGGDGSYTGGSGGNGGSGGAGLGGGIYNLGTLHLENSSFSANSVSGGNGGNGGTGGSGASPGLPGTGGRGGAASGAGLYSVQANTVTVTGCTFSDNQGSGGNSAAAGSQGTAGIAGYSGGQSSGGGIYNSGTLAVTNCTFVHNTVTGGDGGDGGDGSYTGGDGGNGGIGAGGGLYSTGSVSTVYLVNCTLFNGSAVGGTNGVGGGGPSPGSDGRPGKTQGGNLANTNGLFVLKNSIIATNLSGTNGFGTFTDAGYNISSDRSIRFISSTSKTNLDPGLGPFGDHGGPTRTLSLLTGTSPAMDKIAPANAPAFDQRGAPRPVGAASDIGSYEALALVFETQPLDLTQTNGQPGTFAVSVIGDPPLYYQWRFGGTNIAGANQTNYTIAAVASTNAGDYDVIVSSTSGSITSLLATLTVVFPPSISIQPTNQTVLKGAPVSFSVTATGDQPLLYQWQFNGTNISGATNPVYSLSNVQPTNSGAYTVAVTNPYGSVMSDPAMLSIGLPPTILTQPLNQTALLGGSVVFSVIANGTLPLAYQWRFKGTNLAGAMGPTYSRSSVQTNHVGGYDVLVTNNLGTVESATVTLSVLTNAPPIAEPVLVSTNFMFIYPSEVGLTYVFQYKDALTNSNWIPWLTNAGTGGWLTNQMPATNAPSRFFRVWIR